MRIRSLVISWSSELELESGIVGFIVERGLVVSV